MELRAEGAGKSYPPGHYGSLGARTDICDRLIDKGHEEEAIYNIDFRKQLDAHFDRLPSRYLLDMNVDKAEDVLLHQKLLAKARDPEKRPVFHCRFVKNIQIEIFKFETDENDDLQQIRVPSTSRGLSNTEQEVNMPSNIRQDLSHVIVHEIIFSTADQPKLLSQLSVLLSGIGLNIREAFAFSTTDGYSLDIFFVDGWPEEATDSLDNALEQAIARNEWLFSVSCHRVLENVISGQPSCDWEIDIKLLKIGEKIASVSCGDLYHGLYLGEDVAVKVFRLKQLNQPLKVEFNKEFSILRQVQHINVVRFIGACTELPHLCLVTEYMHRGSLYDFLHKHHFVLELPLLLKFAIDICKGMDYLHQNNIIHRDLKTANLLMGANNVVKVADFGVARFQNTSGDMTAETGTYKWMAPEVMNHQPYNHKVDIYSFAIVLWELTTSKIPYNELTPIQAAFGVMKGERPELPRNVHPRLLGLMQSCWDEAPARRPSFSQIAVELEELLRQVQLDHGETSQEVRERSSESTE